MRLELNNGEIKVTTAAISSQRAQIPTAPSLHEAVLPTASRFIHAAGSFAPTRWMKGG